jgi:hypothetical protein
MGGIRVKSKILFLAFAACTLPVLAVAQNAGVQAQGNASAQGGASVQRDNGTAVQSSSSATGNASGTVSRGDKQVGADSGATTNAVLAGSLDAKKAKPGDPVSAKTSEQTTTADGVVLPKGTKLLGRVTEAKAAGKGEGESALGFTFDRAVLKDGREIPLQTTVRALAAADGAAGASDSASGTALNGAGMARGSAGGTAGGLGSAAGGAVGGVGSTAGGALGTTGRVAGGATGTLSSSVGATGRALSGNRGAVGGVNARGMLSSESQGVFGLRGMNLSQSSAGSGSLVTSAGRNVQLDSGTRMLLSVQRGAADAGSSSTGSAGATSSDASKGQPK